MHTRYSAAHWPDICDFCMERVQCIHNLLAGQHRDCMSPAPPQTLFHACEHARVLLMRACMCARMRAGRWSLPYNCETALSALQGLCNLPSCRASLIG